MTELPQYPIVEHVDLSDGPALPRAPAAGAVRRPNCRWVSRSGSRRAYADVKAVYGDRRFGKAMGYGKDTPRMHGGAHGSDTSRLDNIDAPDHTAPCSTSRRRRSRPRRFAAWLTWIQRMTTEHPRRHCHAGPGRRLHRRGSRGRLPLRVISGLLGVSDDFIPTFKAWIDQMTGVESAMERRRRPTRA